MVYYWITHTLNIKWTRKYVTLKKISTILNLHSYLIVDEKKMRKKTSLNDKKKDNVLFEYWKSILILVNDDRRSKENMYLL